MFLLHAAFGLLLIALASGVFLYIWSAKNDSGLGRVFGLIVILLAVIDMLCAAYYGVKYWKEGYFQSPMAMHEMQTPNKPNQNQ